MGIPAGDDHVGGRATVGSLDAFQRASAFSARCTRSVGRVTTWQRSWSVVLCIAVVISAIAAERSARARRRFRAVCLNLFGIGCLGVGLLSLYAWCHGGAVVVRQVAMAEMEANPGTLVRLFARQRPACRTYAAGETGRSRRSIRRPTRKPDAPREDATDPAGRRLPAEARRRRQPPDQTMARRHDALPDEMKSPGANRLRGATRMGRARERM